MAGIPAPVAPLGEDLYESGAVRGVRFADPDNGWVYGPELWATHDGGASWAHLDLAVGRRRVDRLEAANGIVHAVLFDGHSVTIATSPVGTDSWQDSGIRLSQGPGPVPIANLVLQRGAGWLLFQNRALGGGGPAARRAVDVLDAAERRPRRSGGHGRLEPH